MLVRYQRKGIAGGEDTAATESLEVTRLPTDFIAAVSTSASTSFAQESGGTASLDMAGFGATAQFEAIFILSGSISIVSEQLSGSFVSGNIFGGDRFDYTTESLSVRNLAETSSLFVTGTIIEDGFRNFTFIYPAAAGTGSGDGGGGTVPPTEGQIFPRGVC